jgi:hypothetical protein
MTGPVLPTDRTARPPLVLVLTRTFPPEMLCLAAARACASLNPGGSQAGTAESNSVIQQDLKLAQCMRAHGVPNFPDPQTGPGVIANWNFSGTNINVNSSQFQAAQRACQSLNNSPTFPGT